MTNSNYKKYIGYIGAGIFGVLLVIGLRGASAADQTSLPSSNVTPNFSGLNVKRNDSDISTGNVKIDGFLDVKDNIDAEDVNVDKLVAGTTSITGNLDVYSGKSSFYGGAFFNGDIKLDKDVAIKSTYGSINDDYVYIDDGLKVSKKIDVQGGILNSNGDVKISDGFNVDDEFYTGSDPMAITPIKGYYTLLGRLMAYGEAVFKGSTITQGDAHVKGNLDVTGNAGVTGKLSTGDNLTVGGKLGVSGDSVLNGTLKNLAATIAVYDANGNLKEQITPAPVYIDDSLKVTGDLSAASIQISGKATLLGDTEIKNLYATGSIQNSAADGFVKIDDELDVRKGIFNNDGTSLVKLGSGSKPMNLHVTGKIKASGGIGTYSQPSASVTTKAGVTGIASTYCGSTADLLWGCYFSADKADTKVYALDKTISASKKGCYVNFINPSAVTKVMVSAICFNPTN